MQAVTAVIPDPVQPPGAAQPQHIPRGAQAQVQPPAGPLHLRPGGDQGPLPQPREEDSQTKSQHFARRRSGKLYNSGGENHLIRGVIIY